MNYTIAEILAKQLSYLPWLSKVAGLVQEASLTIKGGGIKKIPIASVVYTSSLDWSGRTNLDPAAVIVPKYCEANEDYQDLIPNSLELGIAYFEDQGSKLVRELSTSDMYDGQLLLVVWINKKLIGNIATDVLLFEVMKALPRSIKQVPYVHNGKISIDTVEPNRPSPFEKYSYNEAEKQFLIYPYDYFSFKIKYRVIVSHGCAQLIEPAPIPC